MRSNFRALAIGLLALQVTACAQYQADPLADSPAEIPALQTPDTAILTRDAAAIERPFLAPVTLDFSAPLDANAIAVLAALGNPDLKALRARAGIADAQVFAAGLLPDPTVSLGIDHILSGPDPVDNIAGGLGFDLNALRTRGALRAKAVAEARQVRLDLAWAEWQTAGAARLEAVRILELRKGVANAQLSAAASQNLLARYLKAAGRGDIAPDQVQSTRIAALDAVSNLQSLQTDLGASEYELRRLLGLPPEFALNLAPQLADAPAVSAQQLFQLALANRLDLQALRSGYDAQEAAVHKAVLDQFPNLDLTITGSRDTGDNKLLGPSIGFTLPLWNRNRGGIAIERATREALHAEYEARLFQTRAEISAAVAALDLARRQRAQLLSGQDEIEQFARASRRAAQRGDLAIATADVAEQTARDRQLLLIQVEQAIAEQTIALELLVGTLQQGWTER